MHIKTFITTMKAARRRHTRLVEFRKFCAGGALVLSGLFLANLYCLIIRLIP